MQCYFVAAAKAGMCMYLRRFRYMDHSEVSFWPALMRSLFVFLPLKHQGDLPCGFAWREGLSESFFSSSQGPVTAFSLAAMAMVSLGLVALPEEHFEKNVSNPGKAGRC